MLHGQSYDQLSRSVIVPASCLAVVGKPRRVPINAVPARGPRRDVFRFMFSDPLSLRAIRLAVSHSILPPTNTPLWERIVLSVNCWDLSRHAT